GGGSRMKGGFRGRATSGRNSVIRFQAASEPMLIAIRPAVAPGPLSHSGWKLPSTIEEDVVPRTSAKLNIGLPESERVTSTYASAFPIRLRVGDPGSRW